MTSKLSKIGAGRIKVSWGKFKAGQRVHTVTENDFRHRHWRKSSLRKRTSMHRCLKKSSIRWATQKSFLKASTSHTSRSLKADSRLSSISKSSLRANALKLHRRGRQRKTRRIRLVNSSESDKKTLTSLPKRSKPCVSSANRSASSTRPVKSPYRHVRLPYLSTKTTNPPTQASTATITPHSAVRSTN